MPTHGDVRQFGSHEQGGRAYWSMIFRKHVFFSSMASSSRIQRTECWVSACKLFHAVNAYFSTQVTIYAAFLVLTESVIPVFSLTAAACFSANPCVVSLGLSAGQRLLATGARLQRPHQLQ